MPNQQSIERGDNIFVLENMRIEKTNSLLLRVDFKLVSNSQLPATLDLKNLNENFKFSSSHFISGQDVEPYLLTFKASNEIKTVNWIVGNLGDDEERIADSLSKIVLFTYQTRSD